MVFGKGSAGIAKAVAASALLMLLSFGLCGIAAAIPGHKGLGSLAGLGLITFVIGLTGVGIGVPALVIAVLIEHFRKKK